MLPDFTPPTRLETLTFDYNKEQLIPYFREHWARDRSCFPIELCQTAEDAACKNFQTCINFANKWRESEPRRMPVAVEFCDLGDSNSALHVLITSEKTYIVAFGKKDSFLLNVDNKSIALARNPEPMSIGEFFLKVSYAADKSGSKILEFFYSDENKACIILDFKNEEFFTACKAPIKEMLAAKGSDFINKMFLHSVSALDGKTVSFCLDKARQYIRIDEGVRIAARIKNMAMLQLLGARALYEEQ